MEIKPKNKIVLITGASRGTGRAIVESSAQTQATLAIHYNSNKDSAIKLVESAANNSAIFKAELSQPSQAKKLFEKVINYSGKLVVIINNAGIYDYATIKSDDWFKKWQRTINTNLNSAGLLCKLAIGTFYKPEKGKLLTLPQELLLESILVITILMQLQRAALFQLTKTIARAFGKNNIKAFSIAPGFVRTRMAEEFIEKNDEDKILKEIALAKLTEAKDIAPTVTFLASGMMDHATGCTIDLNTVSYMR